MAEPDTMGISEFIAARRGEDEARAWSVHDVEKCDAMLYAENMADYAREKQPDCDCGHPARMLREVAAKRKITGDQTSDHAPVESAYGTVCRTCVDWQDAPLAEGGQTEFGIAIPQAWPCRVEFLTEDLALTAIGWGLKEAEIHESREWFKLDGQIIDDPHAADRAVA